MNTYMKKIVMAGALIAAATAANAQDVDQSAASPTTVYGQRETADQRINNDVQATIANDSSLDGKIGVQAQDGLVTLTGLVTTPGQVFKARMDAESVQGVKEVDNQVNALVGKNF